MLTQAEQNELNEIRQVSLKARSVLNVCKGRAKRIRAAAREREKAAEIDTFKMEIERILEGFDRR